MQSGNEAKVQSREEITAGRAIVTCYAGEEQVMIT